MVPHGIALLILGSRRMSDPAEFKAEVEEPRQAAAIEASATIRDTIAKGELPSVLFAIRAHVWPIR